MTAGCTAEKTEERQGDASELDIIGGTRTRKLALEASAIPFCDEVAPLSLPHVWPSAHAKNEVDDRGNAPRSAVCKTAASL